MRTTPALSGEAESTIREGWDVLVDKLGIQRATQFIVLLERGKGDSVKEIAEYWGDASEKIHNRVVEWKAKSRYMEDVERSDSGFTRILAEGGSEL